MTKNTFELETIGYVRRDEEGFYLELDERYEDCLIGIEGFTYINVLWWAHMLDTKEYRAITTSEKPYKKAPEKLGIFATRSPVRPNPIALTPVAVLGIYNNRIIRIPYIDAEEGTPILDIKPYQPTIDRVKDVSVPNWCAHWPKWYEDSATFDWDSEFVNAQ